MREQRSAKGGQTAEARHRILLTLWGAQLMSLAMFFGLTRVLGTEADAESGRETVGWLFPALATLAFLLSFLLKRRMLAQSVERQDMSRVQAGYILAFVLCELSGMLGLLYSFLFGWSPLYYFLFGLSAFGLALHFPRVRHLHEASFKQKGFGEQ
ncbi:MAG TPA: hypothetical protein VNA19_11505 [Pyrinomonadaceae bacterium]|jgi:hypothetical protein|nr:hypothetical protein [Pyrinomonadaceae bacterium]